MKPTTYINWDGLKDIPFFYCDTKEDEENKDFDIYYQGRLVLHDYNHCGHYLLHSCCAVQQNQEQNGRLGEPAKPLDSA